MESVEEPVSVVALAAWAPWSRELNEIVDAVRDVAASNTTDARRRADLAALGRRARRLLDQIGCQPSLPGGFGRAIDVLRAPTNAEPIHIADALARLGRLAILVQPEIAPVTPIRRPARRRTPLDQPALPGFDQPNPNNEGALP